MFKQETRRCIEKALGCALAQDCAIPGFTGRDPRELAEDIAALSAILTEQLWNEGYELELRTRVLGDNGVHLSAQAGLR